jgi:hypothetical protein
MMGLGISACRVAPVYSSRLFVQFTGKVLAGTASTNATYAAIFGTGAGPANGVAATGTVFGATPVQFLSAAAANAALVAGGVITGLTPGTTYWFDLGLASSAGGGVTAAVTGVVFTVMEF